MLEQVQVELERRERIGAQYSSSDIFASKLICSDCGGFYGKKTWHAGSKYSRTIYQCNNKFNKNKEKCQTPHLSEEEIKNKFIKAFNVTMEDKDRIIQDSNEVIEFLSDTPQIYEDLFKIGDELRFTSEIVTKLVKENSKTDISLEEYNRKYEELTLRYERLQIKQDELLRLKSEKQGQSLKMKSFVSNLNQSIDHLDSWN